MEYLHRDFSPRFREGQDKARELGLYMQNYCGCVFSEEDRYRKRKKEEKAGRRAGVRRKSGYFGTIRPKYPRNNRFTNARKTGILYHVLAPVAQLDRALDSDSKGHAFESHRAYH